MRRLAVGVALENGDELYASAVLSSADPVVTFLKLLEHKYLPDDLVLDDELLGGLLKHMAIVEDGWFTECLLGDDLPEPWASVDWDADRDWEWHSAADDSPEELGTLFGAACERSRAAAARHDSLDARSVRPGSNGEPFSLRWIFVHMIEEYARHVGHADLLRESIDGQVGDGG